MSALSNEQSAKTLQQKLQSLQQWPVFISTNETRSLHKVRIGPIPEGQEIEDVVAILNSNQLIDSLVLAAHQL